jgi:hypothetical protein
MHYRIYSVDADGHVHGPPDEIECVDDDAAIRRAKTVLDSHDIEVWEGARRVIVLRHTD